MAEHRFKIDLDSGGIKALFARMEAVVEDERHPLAIRKEFGRRVLKMIKRNEAFDMAMVHSPSLALHITPSESLQALLDELEAA